MPNSKLNRFGGLVTVEPLCGPGHRVSIWEPYEGKQSIGRIARWWKCEYRNGTSRESLTQDTLIWKRHAEVFAQLRDATAAQRWWVVMVFMFYQWHTMI